MRKLSAERQAVLLLGLLLVAVPALAGYDLSQDELKLLEDPGGWEYITVSDNDYGIQTQHTCFDGKPHPETCSGTLTLRPDNTFRQDIHIHGETVQRGGTFQLNGDQITFFDEFGNSDGPYTLTLDAQAKTLMLDMPQVHMELMLEKAYQRKLHEQKRQPSN